MELKTHKELKNHVWKLKPLEFEQLEQNILNEGIRDKLIIWHGYIVDGHNRYKIAQKHNLDFEVKEMDFDNIKQAQDWMDANQIGRRNLTQDQWQISIGRRYNREKKTQRGGGDRGNQYTGGKRDNLSSLANTSENLADKYQISSKSVKRYAKKANEYEQLKENKPELAEQIETGDITFRDIKKKEKKEQRKKEIAKQKEAIKKGKTDLPEGKFEVINIDPPWSYGTKYDSNGRRVASPYPEMSQKQLKELDIPASEDSILFLWTTHKFIFEAKELLKHWGFKYRNMLVWDKDQMGIGNLFRMQCEFCLIGIKGKPLLDNNHKNRDIIREQRREHSRKPEKFYKMVENLCVGRKLDYFSREKRDGWKGFGNETNKF